MSLAESFPQPSPLIVDALDQLRLAAVRPPDNESALRRLAMLPCPWDPAACPPELRELLYVWFDAVVAWINEEHTWRLDRVIPICWTQHPHIVHELATVACLRWEADYAVTAATLDEGYRYNLPMFLDRLAIRVGPTGPCRATSTTSGGRHGTRCTGRIRKLGAAGDIDRQTPLRMRHCSSSAAANRSRHH
jgi:hypothetical protein